MGPMGSTEMPDEVLSMAVFRAQPGHEAECLSLTLELAALLSSKGLAQDTLWQQDSGTGGEDYVLLRRWVSDQTRLLAHDDPDVHRIWARMGLIMETIRVYERLGGIEVPPHPNRIA